MDQAKIAELEASVTAAEKAATDAGGTDETLNKAVADTKAALSAAKAPSQGSKYTDKEKATHALKANAEKVRELGLDPAEILGTKTHIEVPEELADDTPLTVGMQRAMQKKDAQTSAIQMADSIADEQTRETVKTYLSDRIKPSGDAEADFRLALAAASAEKNKQVVEEMGRFIAPKRAASGGSAPAKVEEEFTPTAEELALVKGFKFSPAKQEQIIKKSRADAARKG